MSHELEFEVEPGSTIRVPIGPGAERVLVGRLSECAIKTSNRTVSRRHAEFTWSGGQVQVRDLDSTGGTFVNGSRVGRAAISVGDEVICGKMEGRLLGPSGVAAGGGVARGGALPMPDADLGGRGPADSAFGSKTGDGGGGGTAMLDAVGGDDDLWAVADKPARGSAGRGGAVDPLGSATRRAEEPAWVTGPQRPVDFAEVPEPAAAPAPSSRPLPDPAPASLPDPAAAPRPAVASSAGGALEVSFVDHDGSTGSFTVGPGDERVVGRGKGATVKVKHPTVSRAHARFEYRDGKIQLTDLNSSAGTFVAERKIKRQLVEAGAIIHCGKLELRVSAAASGGWTSGPDPNAPWLLTWTDLEGAPQTREIGPGDAPVVIGRNPGVTIRVPDGTVGRRHAEVVWRDGTLHVTDRKSTNGTFVNDKRTMGGPLADGDVLRCGSFPFRIIAPRGGGAGGGGGAADWDSDWGDDWTDLEDMAPPSWVVLFRTDDGTVERELLGPECRMLAVGSDPDCEIHAQGSQMEPDHCEITWEEGVLVANDLKTGGGTWVRGRKVDEQVLKNGDIVTCGTFQLHIVRGAAAVHGQGPTARHSEDAEAWAERFTERDPQLCIVYCYGDETEPDFEEIGREELTLWADGEAKIEDVFPTERASADCRVREGVVELVLRALTVAGFPDAAGGAIDEDEFPVEIAAYQDADEVSTLLGHKVLYRSDAYREAVDLLRSISALARG